MSRGTQSSKENLHLLSLFYPWISSLGIYVFVPSTTGGTVLLCFSFSFKNSAMSITVFIFSGFNSYFNISSFYSEMALAKKRLFRHISYLYSNNNYMV